MGWLNLGFVCLEGHFPPHPPPRPPGSSPKLGRILGPGAGAFSYPARDVQGEMLEGVWLCQGCQAGK